MSISKVLICKIIKRGGAEELAGVWWEISILLKE